MRKTSLQWNIVRHSHDHSKFPVMEIWAILEIFIGSVNSVILTKLASAKNEKDFHSLVTKDDKYMTSSYGNSSTRVLSVLLLALANLLVGLFYDRRGPKPTVILQTILSLCQSLATVALLYFNNKSIWGNEVFVYVNEKHFILALKIVQITQTYSVYTTFIYSHISSNKSKDASVFTDISLFSGISVVVKAFGESSFTEKQAMSNYKLTYVLLFILNMCCVIYVSFQFLNSNFHVSYGESSSREKILFVTPHDTCVQNLSLSIDGPGLESLKTKKIYDTKAINELAVKLKKTSERDATILMNQPFPEYLNIKLKDKYPPYSEESILDDKNTLVHDVINLQPELRNSKFKQGDNNNTIETKRSILADVSKSLFVLFVTSQLVSAIQYLHAQEIHKSLEIAPDNDRIQYIALLPGMTLIIFGQILRMVRQKCKYSLFYYTAICFFVKSLYYLLSVFIEKQQGQERSFLMNTLTTATLLAGIINGLVLRSLVTLAYPQQDYGLLQGILSAVTILTAQIAARLTIEENPRTCCDKLCYLLNSKYLLIAMCILAAAETIFLKHDLQDTKSKP